MAVLSTSKIIAVAVSLYDAGTYLIPHFKCSAMELAKQIIIK